jgi:hypothetical protein
MTTFRDARTFLLKNRTDYDKAVAEFRWPDEKQFNWALDWFDAGLATDPKAGIARRCGSSMRLQIPRPSCRLRNCRAVPIRPPISSVISVSSAAIIS